MIKITLEYASVDQAIVALGKLVGAPVQRVARAAEDPAAAALPAAPATRRGRADKGKPRGPHAQKAAAPAAPDEADNAEPAGVVPPAAAAPAETPTPSAETPTTAPVPPESDAQKALERLFETKPPLGGLEQARAVMARFGVTRLRDLKEESRADFIKLVNEVLAGGKV